MDEITFSFNPTLVRLRQQCEAAPGAIGELFQSHAGSIEAAPVMPWALESTPFQSHAGSIEASTWSLQGIVRRSFNPTLVRLRQNPTPISWGGGTIVSIPRWFD